MANSKGGSPLPEGKRRQGRREITGRAPKCAKKVPPVGGKKSTVKTNSRKNGGAVTGGGEKQKDNVRLEGKGT